MVDVKKLAESDLSPYWLRVWRCLVEAHYDYIVTKTSDGYYAFKNLYKHQSKKSVDDQIAKLATDYWTRNRSDIKEYFINWTCDKWNEVLAIEKDVVWNGWIDCGVDPIYPQRKHENRCYDAPCLASAGKLQELLQKAKLNAFLQQCNDAFDKARCKALNRAKAKRKLMKTKVKKLFKKMVSWLKI